MEIFESLLNCLPCVLTCSRENVPCVLTCPGANVPGVFMCSHANVPCVLTSSRANVPYMLTCSRALPAYVLRCRRVLCAYLLTCQGANFDATVIQFHSHCLLKLYTLLVRFKSLITVFPQYREVIYKLSLLIICRLEKREYS